MIISTRLGRLAVGGSIVVAALGVAAPPVASQPAPVHRAAACFPFETLPEDLRPRAEGLLLRALDSEALYTIGADIKPMSSGLVSLQIEVARPDLADAERLRQIFRAWTCGGEIAAGLHHYAAVYDGRRPLDGVVFNLPAISRLVADRQAFFAPYGLSASADPVEVAMAVEHDATTARLRGYGYLFGYPSYAVDFFVRASDQEKAGGGFVERDFLSLPTVRGERRFVYAVPKGHTANGEDAALRARVDPVFADYQARRARHIRGDDATGVLALVREWFDDGRGEVRPSHAWRRHAAARGLATTTEPVGSDRSDTGR